jgi:PKD repeat protein/lysophospholipase L1-like esterase
MIRRATVLASLSALLLNALLPIAVAAAESAPAPTSMAAVGDSITQAASSDGDLGVDAPRNSWSTGTNTTVNSHAMRLGLTASAANLSVSGAKVGDLDGQMHSVVDLATDPGYLTVLIGGNDLCTDTIAEMTPVDDFRVAFETAMRTVTSGSPDTYVYVVSIPDVHQLWELFKNNFFARAVWSAGNICQSLLANPTSNQQADVDRRKAFRDRNIAYNAVLAEVCTAFTSHCHVDGNAVFGTRFERSDVAGDYFHPSIAGQAKLAAVSWGAGYSWTSEPAPNGPPTASFDASCSGLRCEFTDTSTDADGTIEAWDWTFGDGQAGSTAQHPTHTYATGGTYTVTLTVTDDDDATDIASTPVTVSESGAETTMSVGGLSATTSSVRNTWTATVTIFIVDAAGQPVSNATVSGSWSVGAADTCNTGDDGRCSATSDSLGKKTSSVTFTVDDVTRDPYNYEASANTDSSITVAKP